LEGALISRQDAIHFHNSTAHGWNFLRSSTVASPRAALRAVRRWLVERAQVTDAGEAVPLLSATDDFVSVCLFFAMMLINDFAPRRRRSGGVGNDSIKIEEVLPFSAEEVTTDFQCDRARRKRSVVSAVATK
jgi:hypothetical protein